MQKLIIYDSIGIFAKTRNDLILDSSVEMCYFMACKIKSFTVDFIEAFVFDILNIKDIGGKCYKDNVFIPAKSSLVFLKLCKKNNFIPIIMHTHRLFSFDEEVSFSKEDMNFEKSICALADKLGIDLPIVFSVINSQSFCFRFSTKITNFQLIDKQGVVYEYENHH